MKKPLYFDNNATTPLDPRVLDAMLPFFREHFGNPESVQHAYGWKADGALNHAREQVAGLLNANSPSEIIFTAGATESMNLAILGYLEGLGRTKGPCHLISSVVEHKATLTICKRAEELGHEVTLLPVNRYGQVETTQALAAVKPNTVMVSLLHANNEIGSLNPIAEIAGALRARGGIVLHVDAAQSIGKIPVDVQAVGIDLLSLSGHKFYAPKGVGALFVRRGIHLRPVMFGGGQERGLRSGTHNVPGIVGLGEACAIAARELNEESKRISGFRDQIIAALATGAADPATAKRIELNGHPHERVCNNVHLSIHGIPHDVILSGLSDIAFSTASACSAGGPSHVLKAIGHGDDPLVSSMRFGLGRFTTAEEVATLIRRVREVVHKS